jgi:hypothetical protein
MRMVSRHIGKHIPGNPMVVATNMPGAGQMLVANWLANVAPKDGTAIVALSQNMAVHQATGAAGVRYDVRQFHWIGNTTDTPNVTNAWHTTGIHTIQDVMQRELVVGATGTASGSFLYPYALNQLVGTKFKIVTGYPAATISISRWSVGRSCPARTLGRGSRPARSGWRKRRPSCWSRSVKRSPAARCSDAPGFGQERSRPPGAHVHLRRHGDLAPAGQPGRSGRAGRSLRRASMPQ